MVSSAIGSKEYIIPLNLSSVGEEEGWNGDYPVYDRVMRPS